MLSVLHIAQLSTPSFPLEPAGVHLFFYLGVYWQLLKRIRWKKEAANVQHFHFIEKKSIYQDANNAE